MSSAILPPWCRKTPKITEVLPLLYLHGLSSSDFVPALGQFLGSTAGLSEPVITKLTETWKGEQRTFAARDLSGVDWTTSTCGPGIHVNIRLQEHKLCLLVLSGVRADGRKELVVLADGYRESTESWADLLRDCARRGMRAPVPAVGTARSGSGARYARCSPRPENRAAGSTRSPTGSGRYPSPPIAEIWNAEDRRHALDAVRAFEGAYIARFPKAVAKITDDIEVLLAVYDFPAEHWIHLRTTNPIESTFATVRTARRSPAGPAPARPGWRWHSSSSRPLVRAGATFVNGKLVERPDDHHQPEAA